MPTKPKFSHTDAKFPVTDADGEALLTATPDSVDDPDTRLIDGSNATLTPGGGVEATLNALRRARGPQRAASGEELILTKAGKPIARLTPMKPAHQSRRLGLLDGELQIPDDFNAPLPETLLNAFEGRG